MPKYRIYYESYYDEHSEWSHRDAVAPSKRRALQKFFAELLESLSDADLVEDAYPQDLRRIDTKAEYFWWEGDWLEVYRGIEEIDAEICPICEGTGEVASRVAEGFRSQLSSASP
ncbi:MAG: hypothetical protein Q7T33_15575 [Dehalococcoidia bacterium]|nr:hypothetical protein [Dehalococcoidia bacterium]